MLLLGVSLAGLVFYCPNATGEPAGESFFKIAVTSSVGKLPAAWCSFKIILLCLGLFLVIESVRTSLSMLNRKTIASLIYTLHIVPCLGVLLGGYALLKALL